MSNLTPQKRKSSLPLEKKLEVYEFEVDENEPKTKQKKKRGPKPGTKNKGKRVVVSKKIGVKSPPKNETNKKPLSKLKTGLVPSVKNEIQKDILSTKNSSSPLFENKRRPNEGLKHLRSINQKDNVIHQISEGTSIKNDTPKKMNTILSQVNHSSRRKHSVNEKILIESDQKENLIHPESKENLYKNRKILTPKKRTSKADCKVKNSRSNENQTISSSTPIRNENTFYNTIEVPVLFHNAQDASPQKNDKSLSKQKPVFSALSDDENVDKSYSETHALDPLFHPSCRSIRNNDRPSSSSFYHDSSYDREVSASTPVKYNNDTCNSSVHNCFGFDELEEFEEPLVSPIKVIDDGISTHSGESHYTPYKTPGKVKTPEKKDEIPVTQVIRMLKFGNDDDNVETKSKSSSSGGTSPIFNDIDEDNRLMIVDETVIKPRKLDNTVSRAPRRSYERPPYLRKKHKDYEEEEHSDEEIHEKTVKPKKKHGPSKKEQDEMQKWIRAFNSQCQEIEKFDLLVE
ncbi:hypothetical protein O3M35_008123 [Rhynocoris fuscipes]|uniref:Uncharacterized protein n=1 Tax=Rhynocoris fuscipes TaxID=488301 RepID=A0AAW1D6N8_9HEMI